MQIHDANLNGVSSPATTGAGRTQGTEAGDKARGAAAGVGAGSDAVDLSSFAQQINDLQSDSGARQARVEELQALVGSGQYQVDSQSVAHAIIDDGLLG